MPPWNRTTAHSRFPQFCCCQPLLLDDNRVQTLGVLDVDGLHIAVELLLGALLVVTPPRDADAEPVANTLDTLLPDLLVQLGVEADIGGTLDAINVSFLSSNFNQPPSHVSIVFPYRGGRGGESSGPVLCFSAVERTMDL